MSSDISKLERSANRIKGFFILGIILFFVSLYILSIVNGEEYNSEGKLIWKPGTPERPSISEYLGLESRCGCTRNTYLKSDLKNLGTCTAAYFAFGDFSVYPENPNKMEFSAELFNSRHLRSSDKALPEDWKVPNTWKEFNNSKAPFLFVRKPGEEFEGSETKIIFITKKDHQFYKNLHLAVYEDAHVDQLTEKEAEKFWEMAE